MGRLYTRSGDEGYTYIPFGKRVPKSHPVVEFYGSLDEANSAIGLARGLLRERVPDYDGDLKAIQALLFKIGFSLSGSRRISEEDVKFLETIVDKYYSKPLEKFVLPGGPPAVAMLHLARSFVRRAERRLVALMEEGLCVDKLTIAAINRVSDALFAIALHASAALGYEPEELSL